MAEFADAFEYDVALSYASKDQTTAKQLAKLLEERHLTVFQDEASDTVAWRNEPLDHLVNLYARKARF